MKRENIETLHFAVKGMTCGGCIGTIEKALSAVQGIVKSDVRLGHVRLLIDRTRTGVHEVESILREMGYEITSIA